MYENTKTFRFKQALFIVYTAMFLDLVLGCCTCVITYCLRRLHVSQVYRFCISSLIQSLCGKKTLYNYRPVLAPVMNVGRWKAVSIMDEVMFSETVSEPKQINKGVRQGCGLSPVLFNVDISQILQEFKMMINKGIHLTNRKIINTMTKCYWPLLEMN